MLTVILVLLGIAGEVACGSHEIGNSSAIDRLAIWRVSAASVPFRALMRLHCRFGPGGIAR